MKIEQKVNPKKEKITGGIVVLVLMYLAVAIGYGYLFLVGFNYIQ